MSKIDVPSPVIPGIVPCHEDALVQQNLENFETAHPNIHINWSPIPGDYPTRMRANVATCLQRFWLDEEQFPAIALDGEKNPFPAVSSNPGHLLWSGCLDQKQAFSLCRRLMMPDMFTPWGLRTLSQHAYYYNPIS